MRSRGSCSTAWPSRVRGDRLAGALAVALYHLIPLGFGVMVVGNLTNAFAQSLSVAALALMRLGCRALGAPGRRAVALRSCSRPRSCRTRARSRSGRSPRCVIAVLFWWRGGPALRSPAAAVLLGRGRRGRPRGGRLLRALPRHLSHRAGAHRRRDGGGGAGRRRTGHRRRLASVPRYLQLVLRRAGARPRHLGRWRSSGSGARAIASTLALAGWVLTCGLFLVLGILTPVDMRYYLAADSCAGARRGRAAAPRVDGGTDRSRIARGWRCSAGRLFGRPVRALVECTLG